MPKYYDFMICGYYLYFTSHCIVEAMHVHASDRHLTESGSAKLFVMGKSVSLQKKKRCQQYLYFSDSDSCFILMIMNQFMSMLSRMEMKQNTMYPL